ncbi:YLP motif-containing protein 1 Nuclear protein ZAP3 [Channa argus]|uniref:YLP motif-containing protein 1 n=1 Tax=Channa argus TaxID=215402 RepID=A0A6G1QL42_CHAAH|nr:YLP motif-containing protein 1 Nuclear protein ZAP3 [Channa argus]
MYPSWGNYGGPQSQNYGGSGPRKPLGSGHTGASAGFGGFEASPSGSLFSSLQEQHLQQMQQLQMLHQKQLQSVLQHGNSSNTYSGGHSGGYSGSSWHSEGTVQVDTGVGSQPYYKQDETAGRVPPAPKPGNQQPPPPPTQTHSTEQQPLPPTPEPLSKEANTKDSSTKEDDDKPLSLQEQQQLWYKQHLQNLQKLKQDKAKQNHKEGEGFMPPPPPSKAIPPPPPSEPLKSAPPPPPPKEEPPAPPPPPEEIRPEIPQDPEEAARLQQLQAAAAQWQQVQQQRAGLQYQALMQQHEKLQQILEKYQQLIQQPADLQSMSAEMQLRHYELQQQKFTPLFQDWDRSFILWFEQFQTYPHKDQLQDYERQWKQWQEQMNATNAHLQERVATLMAMVPYASSQYNSGMMGQYGQYPGQDMQMHQQSLNPAYLNVLLCVTHKSGNNPRFDKPQQRFDGPPRFDQPQQRFDGPLRFDQPQQRFDGPTRFDQPQQRFDGPRRFDQPRQRFDGPPRFNSPRFGQQPRFEQTPRLPGPPARFEGPPVMPHKTPQDPQPKVEPATEQPTIIDSKITGKSTGQPQAEKEQSKSTPAEDANTDDLTDDNLLGSKGFFVQNDPIPQTLQTNKDPEESDANKASSNSEKPETVNSKPSVTASPSVAPKHTSAQIPTQPDSSLTNNRPPAIPKPPGIQQGAQASGQIQSKPEAPRPPPGRGRGQPPVPGRGRGQRGAGDLGELNTVPLGEEMGEMSYDYMPPEEDTSMSQEQQEYHWQDPSYEEFVDRQWEEPESSEEGDLYWGERRPLMRGMRPPFPPSRGRPPRGYHGFMLQGRGHPPHTAHGPMDHESLEHEIDNDCGKLDPSRHPMYHGHDPHSHPMHPDSGRGRHRPPLPPHEMIDRGRIRRRPEEYKEEYNEGYVEDYGHGDDGERAPPERDYPPRIPPPEPYREAHWLQERERGRTYSFDEHDRGRGELRILSVTNSVEAATSGGSGANVLALSQRQHEIILKAAQELKLIRELQESKTPSSEPQPAQADILPELPAGLLGLEIPPDVRNVLKGMTAAAQTTTSEPVSWDTKPAIDYKPVLPTPPTAPMIPKTVDYGHGHEPGATVERISYGERIVLRPDPMPSDRGYEKEPLGPRDPYSRDPYYERRPDPYMERRDYSRERELYREKPPPEYERERFERERYPPRERDDSTQSMVEERSPLAPPPRSGYRERDRELRERERSGSRDRDEHYGRPVYDRPPYERTGLDRGLPERYSHGSSPYVERRSYPEDRGPPAAPSLPPPPQPPPRVEKKPEIKNIDDILKPPGRLTRPERDKEVDCGGAPPRVLVLDDYFMTEVEKVEKDPDTGKRLKTKVLEYEYEPEMEDTYRSSMLKTFKKTLDDGFFPFIILDSINDRVKHFDQFWSAAKTKGFEVYLAEITADTQTCTKRNVHGRTHKDIMKMSNNWEPSPRHMVRLDVRSLLQDAAIEEVEMEDFNPDDEPKEPKREEEEENDLGYIPKSKWEMDTSEAKLDKLDGLGSSGKRKREGEHMAGLEDYLQLPDDYATRMSEPGKKRVSRM